MTDVSSEQQEQGYQTRPASALTQGEGPSPGSLRAQSQALCRCTQKLVPAEVFQDLLEAS